MTRETKIGLLVGLAFLLVVGILLSEHITGATERDAAPLADAGHGVRTGMSAPGSAADEPLRLPEPTTPIPAAQDLTPKPAPAPVAPTPANPPVAVVPQPVAPPGNQVIEPVRIDTPVAPPTPANVISSVSLKGTTDPFADNPIAKVAAEHGEAVVPVRTVTDVHTTVDTTVKTNTTAANEYKAQAGDTLSRLAARLNGGNTKANRDAIVKLNPSLQKDPNRVLSGHTYLLPGAAAAPAVAQAAPTPAKKSDLKPVALEQVAEKPAPDAARVYVVKAGDTLSKIASTELGSKTQVGTIKSLNADVLKGGDVIKIDMKLKLPAKTLAVKPS